MWLSAESSESSLRPARGTESVALKDGSLGEILVTLSQEILILATELREMGFNKNVRVESSSGSSRVWNESRF